jgi:phage terminase large subunit-like protein
LSSVNYGGLDVALRVDNTALCVLKLEDGILDQIGQKVWPHIAFKDINDDLLKIQHKERMKAIGYDRLGVGDGAKNLFSREIPLRDIISSQPNKLDMISLVKGLFNQDRLVVHDRDLFREILEQERKISEAGNVLYQHPTGFHDDRFWALCYACAMASHSMAGVVRPRVAVQQSQRMGNLERMADREMDKALGTI